MPPLQAVSNETAAVHQLFAAPADRLRRWLTSAVTQADEIAADLRRPDAADDHEAVDLIRAGRQLRTLADNIAEARRLVDALAHNRLSQLPGARVDVDGTTYKAGWTGESRTLKEPGRREIATRAWETFTDWLIGPDQPKADTPPPVIPDLTVDDRRMLRLALSIAAAEFDQAFSQSPRRTVLSRGLRDAEDDDADHVPWKINVARYETETTGAGVRPTIVAVEAKEPRPE